jgi:cell shape-determining protein MreC
MPPAITSRRGPLIGASLALLVTAILPSKYGEWANGLGRTAQLVIAPVTQPVTQTTSWLLGPADRSRNSPLLAQLERERDQFRTLWLQEQTRTADLRRVIDEMSRGAMVNELRVTQIRRQVIGGTTDGLGGRLQVRAGTAEGVQLNDVATTSGVQLVGKVVETGGKTSWIRLITDKASSRGAGERSAGQIRGVVVDDRSQQGIKLVLNPVGDGKLQGSALLEPGQPDTPMAEGQEVRLDDPQWPRSATMLLIGKVERAWRGNDGRQYATVRPTADLERLSEVVLRLTRDEAPAGAATSATPGGRR